MMYPDTTIGTQQWISMVANGDEKAGGDFVSISRQNVRQGAHPKNDPETYDPYRTFIEEIERLGEAISTGQKKEKNANLGIAGLLVALLGGSGYYISNAPRPQYAYDAVRQYIRENPQAVRPDPWTGTQARRANDEIKREFREAYKRKVLKVKALEQRIAEDERKLYQLIAQFEALSKEFARNDAAQREHHEQSVGRQERIKMLERLHSPEYTDFHKHR